MQAACIAAAEFLATRTKALVDDLLELHRGQLPAYGEETMEELRERIRVVLELAQRRPRQGEVPDIREAEEIATGKGLGGQRAAGSTSGASSLGRGAWSPLSQPMQSK